MGVLDERGPSDGYGRLTVAAMVGAGSVAYVFLGGGWQAIPLVAAFLLLYALADRWLYRRVVATVERRMRARRRRAEAAGKLKDGFFARRPLAFVGLLLVAALVLQLALGLLGDDSGEGWRRPLLAGAIFAVLFPVLYRQEKRRRQGRH